MSFLNDFIGIFSPKAALARETMSVRRQALMASASHYQGAGRGRRGADFRTNSTDAVESMRADRGRMSYVARDMVRNNPRAVKATRVLVNSVVGSGIVPTVKSEIENVEIDDRIKKAIIKHLTSKDIDADGKCNVYGLQSLAFRTIVGSGEVLIRRRYRRSKDGYRLPVQFQVLEADFLNENIDGDLPNGNRAVQGIELDKLGKRVAYHLYAEHPGGRYGAGLQTRRVEAKNIIHAFDVERSGQQRGISWFAPVITLLHDLHKYQDGQVKRQEIATLFAAIYKHGSDDKAKDFGTLEAGGILHLNEDEDIDFTDPPSVDGYEPFMRVTDRAIAGGLGITYEGLTGDYTNTNYSSGRMGRLDTDPSIKHWQENLMITQVCDDLAGWIAEAVEDTFDLSPEDYRFDWTAQSRPVLDPTKDWPAMNKAVRSGFKSKRGVIREFGGDPDKVEAEIKEEQAWSTDAKINLDTVVADKEPPKEKK